MKEEKEEQTLDDMLARGLGDQSEMGEVTKEFSENKPSSSNLTPDEFRLVWRGESILEELSPSSVKIVNRFVDMKRSVNGWNTDKKVQAITGIQEQRTGGMGQFMKGLLGPRNPQ